MNPPNKRTIVKAKRKSKPLQDVMVDSFNSHNEADKALEGLVKSLALSPKDPSYKKKIVPFKKNLNAGDVQKVGKLVDSFITSKMSKDTFKDNWRGLKPNTDEHFSTQSIYTILDTIRSNKLHKSSIDMDVLKDNMAVISDFRLPTEETGHNAKGFDFAHPRGDKQSLYIDSKRSPSHSRWDLFRRTAAFSAGDEHSQSHNDGTGTLLSMLLEAGKITLHFVGSTQASDIKLSSKISAAKRLKAFNGREEKKLNYSILEGIALGTQATKAQQYKGYSSPADRSLQKSTKGVRKRARSFSPAR